MKPRRICINVGDKFGKLTVIEELKSQDRKHRKIKCICECGNYHITQPCHLSSGHVTQCTKCSYNVIGNKSRKYNIQYVKEFYNNKNITFLDDWFNNSKDRHNLKCKKCGYMWNSTFTNSQKHGCPNCQRIAANNSVRYSIDEIKCILSKFNIIFLDDKYTNQLEEHNFKCLNCNQSFTGKLTNIINSKHGHRCKMTVDNVRQYLSSKDIQFCDSSFNSVNDRYHYKCNRCGYIWYGLFYRLYYSNISGCPKCHRVGGGGEQIIGNILKCIFPAYNIKRQYTIRTFNKFINKYVCQFIDFYIDDLKLAIEYNGRQHYETVVFPGLFISDLNLQTYRDQRKREYCNNNGIKLIEIDGREYEKCPSKLTKNSVINILNDNGIIIADQKL